MSMVMLQRGRGERTRGKNALKGTSRKNESPLARRSGDRRRGGERKFQLPRKGGEPHDASRIWKGGPLSGKREAYVWKELGERGGTRPRKS